MTTEIPEVIPEVEVDAVPKTVSPERAEKHSPQAPEISHQPEVQPQSDASEPTVLITEGEVLLSTAVAEGSRRKRHRWIASLSRIFAAAPTESRPKRPHIPSRMSYLEAPSMEREMHRL